MKIEREKMTQRKDVLTLKNEEILILNGNLQNLSRTRQDWKSYLSLPMGPKLLLYDMIGMKMRK